MPYIVQSDTTFQSKFNSKECVIMAKATTKGKKKPMTDNTATEATTGGKLTLEQKIENTRKLLAKYEAQRNSLAQINNVQVGDEGVTFKFGRSDKAREETGTVIAVADSPQGKMVAIQTGEGLDVAVRKVRAADIISNPAADARNADDASVDVEADADPLSVA